MAPRKSTAKSTAKVEVVNDVAVVPAPAQPHDIAWIDTSRKGEATWRCMCMESNTVKATGTPEVKAAAAVADHRKHLAEVNS